MSKALRSVLRYLANMAKSRLQSSHACLQGVGAEITLHRRSWRTWAPRRWWSCCAIYPEHKPQFLNLTMQIRCFCRSWRTWAP